MTVLIISPDYISHYNPLSVLARAATSAGARVVIATGKGMRPLVEAQGYEWRQLTLGASSNTSVVAADPAIRDFLAATAAGPTATITYQAEQREKDLLWQPERVVAEIGLLLDHLQPDTIIVDHVSFASTLGVYASGRPFTTLVPGHPSQLPVGSEQYGVPPSWPTAMQPPVADLAALEAAGRRVSAAFTRRWNLALQASGSAEPTVDDAFRVHGHKVLYNSVAALADVGRSKSLGPAARFVGPLVRQQTLPDAFASWNETTDDRPRVYVGLGTFLSHRKDVLAKIAEALRLAEVRAAIALGPTPIEELGAVPSDWHVAPTLPQVGLLRSADLAIHHGGNNSVQESLASGIRQITLPFSTDQFANAADLEREGYSSVLDPNMATAADIAETVARVLSNPPKPPFLPLTEAELAAEILGSAAEPI